MIFQKDFWETVRIYRHSQYQNIHLTLQEKSIERVLHEIQFESKFVGGSFMDKKNATCQGFFLQCAVEAGTLKNASLLCFRPLTKGSLRTLNNPP